MSECEDLLKEAVEYVRSHSKKDAAWRERVEVPDECGCLTKDSFRLLALYPKLAEHGIGSKDIHEAARCQSTRKECQEIGTEERKYLTGPRMLCSGCAKITDIASEILEPLDREIIEDLQVLAKQELAWKEVDCSACNGTGKVAEFSCPMCKGSGKLMARDL